MKLKQFIKTIVSLCIAVASVSAFAMTDKAKNALLERLTPAGVVCLSGNPKCAVAVNTGEPRPGGEVYETACAGCHTTGAAGAPKLGDVGAWASRMSKGKSSLYSNAINGVGAMPAKGACASCSDDEIKVAVDFMITKSK
ncbi:MAG: c-type cytochrome [Pseudomonadota bacterium]